MKIKNKNKLKVLSTFAGVGGFELGFDKDKFATIGFCEVDEHCNSVLRYHWPNVRNYGSVTNLRLEELPDFDVLVGGWPCQGNSIAGKRKGLADPRSGLFLELIKILAIKRPRYFIFENVFGLLNANNGRDFAVVQMELASLGYDIRWEVLNASEFSVPQNRERVFIVGRFRVGSRSEVFFKGRDIVEDDQSEHEDRICDNEDQKSKMIFYGGLGNKWNRGSEKNQSRDFKQGNRIYSEDGIAPQLNAQSGNAASGSVLVAYSKSTRKAHVDHRIRVDDNANTLSAGEGCRSQSTANFVCEKDLIRRLTPQECEMLMGWPRGHTRFGIDKDGKKIELSDSKRYKMCGNGVVSACVQSIADFIYEDFINERT